MNEQYRHSSQKPEEVSSERRSPLTTDNFDNLSIQEGLYKSDPGEAKRQIIQNLSLDRDNLRLRLIEQEVPENIISGVQKLSIDFSINAMRTDNTLEKYQPDNDLTHVCIKAFSAWGSEFSRDLKRLALLYLPEEPNESDIIKNLKSYSYRVIQEHAFSHVHNNKHLSGMVDDAKSDTYPFPNIQNLVLRQEAKTPPESPSEISD